MSETTKKYELRELCAKDSFMMMKIVNKIGVKNFKECFESEEVKAMVANDKEKDVNAIGMTVMVDIVSVMMENIPSCEKEIYAFLSSLSGLKPAEIEQLPMSTFTEMIIDVFQKDNFADFIQVVSKLFK